MRTDRVILTAMLSTLRHRGPDGNGMHIDEGIALAHARLSIIDLEGGAQPMSVENGLVWISFNGEIFNYVELREELVKKRHKFQTHSDTEVVLRLYLEKGERCVEDLNGQWAFAIWDGRNQKLFLSRDRMGVRPLFYTSVNENLVFASEIKAIQQYPGVARTLDLKALDQIFTFWVTIPPRTIFNGIFQLPPGHCMTVKDGCTKIFKYWEPHYIDRESRPAIDEHQTAEQLLALLDDAIRIRLRADVPVGAYLSGGIDSTFITALVHRIAGDRLRTFSVGFESTDFDESGYQAEASRFLKTEHAQICCRTSDIGRVFPEVVQHIEQPVLRTAPAPLHILSGLVRQSGFKVVLTGEGSDEIFGGYDIYKEAKIRRFWAAQPSSKSRATLLRKLYPYLQNIQRQPAAYLQQFFQVKKGDIANPFFSHLPRWELTSKLKLFFSTATRNALTDYDCLAELHSQLPESYSRWPEFCQAQYLETVQLLPGYILSSQGDRMAMANSVEGRYPFLDHRVVDFASQLPPNLKMKVLNEKYLLKRAAAGLIPDSILRRSKQPYRAPDGQSFFGKNAPEYVRELLDPRMVEEYGVFDSGSVSKLAEKFMQGRIAPTAKDDMALVGVLSTQLVIHHFNIAC